MSNNCATAKRNSAAGLLCMRKGHHTFRCRQLICGASRPCTEATLLDKWWPNTILLLRHESAHPYGGTHTRAHTLYGGEQIDGPATQMRPSSRGERPRHHSTTAETKAGIGPARSPSARQAPRTPQSKALETNGRQHGRPQES